MKVDFHTHTTASDGTLRPQEIVKMAHRLSLEYLAITDHDTLDGLKSINNVPEGLTLVSGVELSAQFPTTLHILGYGFDPDNVSFNAALNQLQEFRKDRNILIIDKLNALGLSVTLEELLEEAGSELVGRPHFANVLVKKGYVNSLREAFERYLKKGAPAYLDKKRFEIKKAIGMIHKAGGISVMAHPYQTGLEGKPLEELVQKLVSLGLNGIEVYYSQHTGQQIQTYKTLADKYSLFATAGSDFHGNNKPDIPLGMDVSRDDIGEFISNVE